MAVPKHKTSKARTASRKANFKATPNSISACPQCHEMRQQHTVCAKCGFYNGEKRIETKKAKKEESK